MGDVFKEQIVKKESTAKDFMMKVAIVIAAALIFLLALMIPILSGFAMIILAVEIFGVYILFSRLNIEYEYVFTNGELDIDVIYSKSRRKRLYSGRVADFELMAHVEDKAHAGAFSGASGTKDYSSGRTKPNTYAALATVKGVKTKILLEPNESMLKAFSTVLTPRKLFKKI